MQSAGGFKMTKEADHQNVIALCDQILGISRGYKKEATEALIELEALAIADKLGLPLEMARNNVRELLEKGELEVRPSGDGKFILCDRGGTAKWLHAGK